MKKKRIAIVGAGAAGLSAAYHINQKAALVNVDCQISLFEKGDRFGGHAHTLSVEDPSGQALALDIGFMVLNNKTYPCLHQLLSELGLADVGNTEMSFSYQDLNSDFYYGLNFDMQSLFDQDKGQGKSSEQPLGQKHLLTLLPHILRFFRRADRDLSSGALDGLSLKDYLDQIKAPQAMVDHYLMPMAAGIWSTDPGSMSLFPAKAFVQFYKNHGIYDFKSPPQWQYLPSGSTQYVSRIINVLKKAQHQLITGANIKAVIRNTDSVSIEFSNNQKQTFDKIIFACHADQALEMITSPSDMEKTSLSCWEYQVNPTYIHTDERFMPPADAWASWNYTRAKDNSVSMTYHLNRLQSHLNTQKQYMVTLNPHMSVAEEALLYQIDFKHPVYGLNAFTAQDDIHFIQGEHHSYFCGAYLGYGFHEDAIRSGKLAAECLMNDIQGFKL